MQNPFARILNRRWKPQNEVENHQKMMNNRKNKNRKRANMAKRSRAINARK